MVWTHLVFKVLLHGWLNLWMWSLKMCRLTGSVNVYGKGDGCHSQDYHCHASRLLYMCALPSWWVTTYGVHEAKTVGPQGAKDSFQLTASCIQTYIYKELCQLEWTWKGKSLRTSSKECSPAETLIASPWDPKQRTQLRCACVPGSSHCRMKNVYCQAGAAAH